MPQEAHTQITPFNNGEFQIDMIPDGDSFKVAAPGLAKSLGFAEARDMLRSIPEAEKGSEIAPTLGGEQRITVVTEAGFYRAIGNRQAARVKDVNIRAQVERFQSWVYGEVLPTIRKTGGYRVPEMSRDELMARAVIFADSRIKELESANHQQAEQLAAAAPAVEYHDTYVTDEDFLYFSDVASTLGIQESELRELLISHKWIYVESYSRWSETKNKKITRYRYTEYSHKKPYFHRSKNHKVPRFMGTVMHTLMVTPAGAAAIKRAVGKWLRAAQAELEVVDKDAA